MARIGVIADTHGLLRPEVFEVFREVDHILHAGDVGPASILDELEAIAPVTAVYGNTDGWEVRGRLPPGRHRRARRLHHRRHPRRQVRQPDARAAAGRVPRRRDHRLRPHPPPAAHAGRRRGDRDEPGRRRAAALRPAGLGGHPRAGAGHPAARPPGPADTAGSGIAAARLRRLTAALLQGLPSARRHPIRSGSAPSRGLRRRTGASTAPPGAAPAAHRHGQGQASVWLLRAADTAFVAVAVPDRSRSWADGVAVCFDIAGDRAAAPAHDDFQWSLRRVLDSSVVYRGRDGRWEPPRGRSGLAARRGPGGGGWEVSGADDGTVWSFVLRLDPAWLDGRAGPSARHRVPDSRRRSQPLVQLACGHVAGRGQAPRAHAGAVGAARVSRWRSLRPVTLSAAKGA